MHICKMNKITMYFMSSIMICQLSLWNVLENHNLKIDQSELTTFNNPKRDK